MLLELFQTTPVNTKQNQDMHGMRLVYNRRDHRTRSYASVFFWSISHPSFILAWSSPCHKFTSKKKYTCLHAARFFLDHPREHQAKTRQAWHAARLQSPQQPDQVRCFSDRLKYFLSVVYTCLHAPRIFLDHPREHQAKTRHAWHAARLQPPRPPDQVRCFSACLKN